MPVIVIGGDTTIGRAIVHSLAERPGEVRTFVSSPEAATTLRSHGVKIAVGDLSDDSHVGAAATGAYCAVLVTEAAHDGRSFAFAEPDGVVEGWLRAVGAAGVTRVIVVGQLPNPVADVAPEMRVLATDGMTADDIAHAVVALDEAQRL